MPCHDPRDQIIEKVYESGISPEELKKYIHKSVKLESVLCAIFNELERRDIAESVIVEASRSGLIDIFSLWTNHKKDDVARISAEIHKYSKDEQDIIKNILNK